MVIHKGFRYRIYPTASQIARMGQWDDALRFLWNLALEQRLMGLRRTDKVYPTAFDQINELTQLRAELPWLADVPRDVCEQLLIELDKAFQRCFKRLGRLPRFKRKGRDALSLIESHPKMWRLSGTTIRFPKLGNLRAVIHRPLEGKPKTCTIKRDVDQWFASIMCEIEINPVPRTEPVVAIDRGVTNLLADSDGRIVVNPKHLERASRRLARAQRTVSRRKKGSKNREKAKTRVMRLHRKVRRQREHVLHVESARYAKSHGVVVIEDLKIMNMTRSAAGTVEDPGTNVAQKRGLNRSILAAGWGQFAHMLDYKLEWSGGTLDKVYAAYSSQTCAVCGHIDAESRHGERFCCTACGNVDHADVNAAKVVKSRANRSALPVEASGLPGLRSRKVKSQLRVPRRSSSQNSSL
jgi:putative transposase